MFKMKRADLAVIPMSEKSVGRITVCVLCVHVCVWGRERERGRVMLWVHTGCLEVTLCAEQWAVRRFHSGAEGQGETEEDSQTGGQCDTSLLYISVPLSLIEIKAPPALG